MQAVALSGNDTIIINGRVLTDLPDADVATLDFPNNLATLKTGKNGNSIYSVNESGRQAELKIRVLRASSDDKFLLALLTQQKANFAGFILMTGELVKQIGDGKSNIASDTYILGGGIFTKDIPAKSNTEGDTEQSTSTYIIHFSNAPRAIT